VQFAPLGAVVAAEPTGSRNSGTLKAFQINEHGPPRPAHTAAPRRAGLGIVEFSGAQPTEDGLDGGKDRAAISRAVEAGEHARETPQPFSYDFELAAVAPELPWLRVQKCVAGLRSGDASCSILRIGQS